MSFTGSNPLENSELLIKFTITSSSVLHQCRSARTNGGESPALWGVRVEYHRPRSLGK